DVEAALAAIRTVVAEAPISLQGKKVAVQARKAEAPQAPIMSVEPSDVKKSIDEALVQVHGAIPVIREMEWVVSVFLTRDTAYIGWSAPHENLSSWSGGAVHYRKEEGQISRARFKLMEAEEIF